MSPGPAKVEKFRFEHPIVQIIGCLICLGIAAASLQAPGWRWLSVLFLTLGIGYSVSIETEIDSANRSVFQIRRLFMLFPVWSKRFPLSNFVAVLVRLTPANPIDSESFGTWTVGLKPANGKVLDVIYITEARLQEPSDKAESQIQRLAEVTRLPIERVLET